MESLPLLHRDPAQGRERQFVFFFLFGLTTKTVIRSFNVFFYNSLLGFGLNPKSGQILTTVWT